jgi:murein L,D-transpeptidase YcbB/YkuD
MISAAGEDALDPASYGATTLPALADSARSGTADEATLARFDATLTAGLLTFLSDVHRGRVDPRKVGFKLDRHDADAHDVPALMTSAIAANSLEATLDALRPQIVLYRRLREALAHYRTLAQQNDSFSTLETPKKAIKPGERLPWARALADRLVILGDLARNTPADSLLDGPLADGLKRFQDRHGIEPDGVLGKATVAELNTSLAQRVRQLELSMERVRWLPDFGGSRLLVVNIPAYRLWAWDSLNSESMPAFEMKVIVGGEGPDTRTPVFMDEMRYVVFRPYWNVPPSIAKKEVLPAIAKNPGYLAANDMELVRGQADNSPVVEPSAANLAAVERGDVRVRQRPGDKNALGLVKFIFPNDVNVYLHGTPAQEKFARARRDLSHGCIRVEDPVKLAEFVLQDVPGWDRPKIESSMNADAPGRVNLKQPLPVVLFYMTAFAAPDGTVGFYHDIYHHDDTLEQALKSR